MPSDALSLTQNPARYNGWLIYLEAVEGGGEVFDKPTRTVRIDPSRAGPRAALAHALAHIHLNHVYEIGEGFTDEQEDAADRYVSDMLSFREEMSRLQAA